MILYDLIFVPDRTINEQIYHDMNVLQKPLWQMNGAEFLELQRMVVKPSETPSATNCEPRLVYGLRGLSKLLGCSHTTANKIKHDPRLQGCYSQIGKKIVFDADKVLNVLMKSKL